MKPILLASPHMGGTEMTYVQEAFDTNWISPVGPNIQKFEKDVEDFISSDYIKPKAVALSSGTAAIHMALRLLDVTSKDIVLVSDFTFIASVNPILYQGATPIFIDSETETWNMSPKALEHALSHLSRSGKLNRVKAVIVVHLYGQSAKMSEIYDVCGSYGVPIIEDAAESLGATYRGKHTGTLGAMGIYSFNGNKIITTSGGGMLVTQRERYAERARHLSTQARENEDHYEHTKVGYNYRMSNVSAGIGRGQMEVLSKRIAQKKAIFEKYAEAFKDIEEIEMMPISSHGEPNYWLSAITFKTINPRSVLASLKQYNIETRPLWKPMHTQPVFLGCQYYTDPSQPGISYDLYRRGLCLPSDTKMTEEEQDFVISLIKKCCGGWL